MPSYAPRGPAPKPQRRRRNVPASYGAAEPTTVPTGTSTTRELWVEYAHPLVADLWEAVHTSCESRFFSAADWERARMELWFASAVMRDGACPAAAWTAVQAGLNALLISPATKRRAGIELRPVGVDADAVAADNQIARYKTVLKSV